MKTRKLWTFAAIVALTLAVTSLAIIGCKPEPDGNDTPVTPQNQTPTEADFDIGNLSQIKGNITAVTIEPKQGKSNGAITVYYNGSTTLPAESGAYAVTFDVAASSGWNTATGLNAGTLGINDAIITSLDGLATYLSGKTANTATTPFHIAFKIANEDDFTTLRTTLDSATDKYVYLDLSGSTVTSIPNYAFDTTATLAGITIPNSVTSIGVVAFYNCTSLASVTIGSGVTSTNDFNPFPGCTTLVAITVAVGNTAYTADNGVLYTKDKTTLVAYPAGKKDAPFTIPNTVTSIESAAFYQCTGLTSVTIPNGVTSIGDNAFSECTGLTSITIPNSVTSIGTSAFSDCTNLASITIPNSVTSIGVSAFSGTAWLQNQENGVVYINKIAYYYNGAMSANTSIILANDTIGIADNAFYNQINLASITIPDIRKTARFT